MVDNAGAGFLIMLLPAIQILLHKFNGRIYNSANYQLSGIEKPVSSINSGNGQL
jgi:hypothetical protein